MTKNKTERLVFAYLLYTDGGSYSCAKTLLRIYRTRAAAIDHMTLNRGARKEVPCKPQGSRRIYQQVDEVTGQYWYIEKHVMCDM